MAVETENVVHALALVSLANPPILGSQNGFIEGSLTRVSTGVHRISLVTPLDTNDGIALISNAAGSSRQLSATIQDLASDGPNNVILYGFDDAGDPADVGPCALVIYRFPRS